MWVAGNRGVFHVKAADVMDVMDGRAERLRTRVFGRAEGLPGLLVSFDFSPSACEGRDGRLWFALRNGLLMVRPEKLRENTDPPPVVLERITVDDQTAAVYGTQRSLGDLVSTQTLELDETMPELRLSPEHYKLEFDFAALSFTSPENVHFRYQLHGFDQKWIEAGTANRATYPRLPAGSYGFRVIACNHAGVWNETGAAITVVVAPFYWQTWWFRGLAVAMCTASLIAVVRYASFRRLRARMTILKQQAVLHHERARIARDMHDEVGAKLTRLSLLSDMATTSPNLPPDANADVREISETARETILAFDEIVWAVNPRNDTLGDLVSYLCRHAEDFFEGATTQCVFDLPKAIPPVTLPTEVRHEVFLAAKEALSIVEDDAKLRETMVRYFAGQADFKCLCTYPDAETALSAIPQNPPDVVLMDINLPGMNGIECVARLHAALPDLKIIMLTVFEDSERVFNSLSAGAFGYLVKSNRPAKILQAIRDVYEGGSPMSGHIARMVVQSFEKHPPAPDETASLTPRELEVLHGLSCGQPTNKSPQNLASASAPSAPTSSGFMKNSTSTARPKPS